MKMNKIELNKKNIILVVVVIAVIIAIVVAVVSMTGKTEIKEGKYPQEEISVDLSKTKCGSSKKKSLVNKANKISLEYATEKIAVGYDETTGEDILANVFNVTITNVTEDFYVIVKNDYTNEETKLTNNDAKDNKVVFQTMYSNDIITYTVEVYTTTSKCKDELYRKFTFKTPIFNIYTNTSYCTGNEDFEYCKEEIFTSQLNFDEFTEKLEEYKKSKKK